MRNSKNSSKISLGSTTMSELAEGRGLRSESFGEESLLILPVNPRKVMACKSLVKYFSNHDYW